jgi:hypothetical protein
MRWATMALLILFVGFGLFFAIRMVRLLARGRLESLDRFAIFSATWLGFFAVSSWVVYKLSDVGAGYWVLGLFAFPLIALLFYGADRRLGRTAFARNNAGIYMALMCLAGILLYWPGMMLSLWLGLKLFG